MKYFKTDGIRGVFKKDDLSIDLILQLGFATRVFKEKRILVAYDTRYSSSIILELLKYSIRLANHDVVNLGMTSTPFLMYCSKILKLPAIMITASHNDFTYNGLKVIYKGKKIDDNLKEKMENLMAERPNKPIKIGKYSDKYLLSKYLKKLNKIKTDNSLKIGFDLANGSMCFLYSYLKNRFKNALFTSYNPDGVNINAECGSLHPERIRRLVIDNKCDIGFSFDGDGDRVILCDKDGKIYNGDMIVAYLAMVLKEEKKLLNNTVIYSSIVNPGITNYLRKKGIKIKLVDVGDENISKEISIKSSNLGGEKSGHVIFDDKFNYSDGIITALNVLKFQKKHSIKILNKIIPYYEKSVNVLEIKKPNLVMRRLNEMMSNGVTIIRKSGTEGIYRVLIMSSLEQEINDIYNEFVKIIE